VNVSDSACLIAEISPHHHAIAFSLNPKPIGLGVVQDNEVSVGHR
jgi:hypothetical protein